MANYNNYVIIKAADEEWESHPYSGGYELGGASLCGVATGIEEEMICWVNPDDTSAPVQAEDQNPHLDSDSGNRAQIEEYVLSFIARYCGENRATVPGRPDACCMRYGSRQRHVRLLPLWPRLYN